MPVRKSPLCLKWPVHDVAPDEEHRCLLILAREVVIKDIVCAVWPVVESVAYCLGLRYAGHVRRQSRVLRGRTFGDRPPYGNGSKW